MGTWALLCYSVVAFDILEIPWWRLLSTGEVDGFGSGQSLHIYVGTVCPIGCHA